MLKSSALASVGLLGVVSCLSFFSGEAIASDGCTKVSNGLGSWSAVSSMIRGSYNHSLTLLPSGQVLAIGGRQSINDPVLSRIEFFDPLTRRWTWIHSLTHARYGHSTTLLEDGRILIVGGRGHSEEALGTAELYDPETGAIEVIPVTPRAEHTATRLENGRVLVFGGRADSELVETVDIFDPQLGWLDSITTRSGRRHHSATLMSDGRVAFIGGFRRTTGMVTDVDFCTPNPVHGCLWERGSELPAARGGHAAALLPSGEIFIVGGFSAESEESFASAWLYRIENDSWRPAASMENARNAFSMALLPSGAIVVAGGRQEDDLIPACEDLTSVEIYFPEDNLWFSAQSLELGRFSSAAVLLPSGAVLMTGGKNNLEGNLRSALLFQLDLSVWEPGAVMAELKGDVQTVLMVDGNLFTAGGSTDGPGSSETATIEIFDSGLNAWHTSPAALQIPRSSYGMVLLQDGRVLIVGGLNHELGLLASMEIYDPENDSIGLLGLDLSVPRRFSSATVLSSGEVLICGGETSPGIYSSTCDLVDVTEMRSTEIPMGLPRFHHSAIRLPNGYVVIAGGLSASGPERTVEIYDPFLREFRSTAPMNHARWLHASTLLPDGRVLVSGGNTEAIAEAEIYDAQGEFWIEASPMMSTRAEHQLLTRSNGEVIAAGGLGSNGEIGRADTEIYDPISNTWRPGPELSEPRSRFGFVELGDGRVAAFGGFSGESSLDSMELWRPETATEEQSRPRITDTTEEVEVGGLLTVTGTGFVSDFSSSGDRTRDSAVGLPMLTLRSLSNGEIHPLNYEWVSTGSTQSTLTAQISPGISPGFHALQVSSAAISSRSRIVEVVCNPQVIVQQPRLVSEPALGDPAVLEVATSGGVFLQWLKEVDLDGQPPLDLVPIPGAHGPRYVTPPVTSADLGTSYRVRAHSNCSEELSDRVTLSLSDAPGPQVSVQYPEGGEYWSLGENRLVTWSMADPTRICEVRLELLASLTDGECNDFDTVETLFEESMPPDQCAHPGVSTTSFEYSIPSQLPSHWQPGSRFHVRVSATNSIGVETYACSPRSFNIIEDPGNYETLILVYPERMMELGLLLPEEEPEMRHKLEELADHPRVKGLIVDLEQYPSLSGLGGLYERWDLHPENVQFANDVLFGPSSIHELMLDLLQSFPSIRYLIIVGDDRIVPMARIPDQTISLASEQHYAMASSPFAGMTAATVTGKALEQNYFLSDDPIAVELPQSVSEISHYLLAPDRPIGRLVETPSDIIAAIDAFIRNGGRLDLTSPGPLGSILVTGYDFLSDSALAIFDDFASTLGENMVNGDLIGTWSVAPGSDAADTLRSHLSGSKGLACINGHGTHFLEGVPAGDIFTIEGLAADRLYGPNSCSANEPPIDLDGSVIYAVGCHGGLPVPGSCPDDEDSSLDLPQTFLSRGVLAYIANSGYGWGLRHGIGYSEQLQVWMSRELMTSQISIGEAVRRAKLRYFTETPRITQDPYAQKTLNQWTLFGFPMTEIRMGLSSSIRESEEDQGWSKVEREPTTESATPDYMIRVSLTYILDAEVGIYRRFTAEGIELFEPGCPSDTLGCYFSFLDHQYGSTDLPIEPYSSEDVGFSGTSHHGVLWYGVTYREENHWKPLFGSLITNIEVPMDIGSLPHTLLIGPLQQDYGPVIQDACRTTDVGFEPKVLMTLGEAQQVDQESNSWVHRRYLEIDVEHLYFNRPGDGCDRVGPVVDSVDHTFLGNEAEWRVVAQDEDGAVWRVVVVYTDHLLNELNEGTWRPIELELVDGVWIGAETISNEAERLTYVVQAVDDRGNVSWLQFSSTPESEVPLRLPLATSMERNPCGDESTIFCSDFESADFGGWLVQLD